MVNKRRKKTITAVTTPRKSKLEGMKQKNTELTPITDKTPVKVKETTQNIQEKSNSIVNQTPPEEKAIQLQRIVKKKQYRALQKMIREGKYTSAMVSARILGVDKTTILSWLKTPKLLRIMEDEVNNYVGKIQQSKDWKAQAYLLDKLEGTKEDQETKQELKQLIVINT